MALACDPARWLQAPASRFLPRLVDYFRFPVGIEDAGQEAA